MAIETADSKSKTRKRNGRFAPQPGPQVPLDLQPRRLLRPHPLSHARAGGQEPGRHPTSVRRLLRIRLLQSKRERLHRVLNPGLLFTGQLLYQLSYGGLGRSCRPNGPVQISESCSSSSRKRQEAKRTPKKPMDGRRSEGCGAASTVASPCSGPRRVEGHHRRGQESPFDSRAFELS